MNELASNPAIITRRLEVPDSVKQVSLLPGCIDHHAVLFQALYDSTRQLTDGVWKELVVGWRATRHEQPVALFSYILGVPHNRFIGAIESAPDIDISQSYILTIFAEELKVIDQGRYRESIDALFRFVKIFFKIVNPQTETEEYDSEGLLNEIQSLIGPEPEVCESGFEEISLEELAQSLPDPRGPVLRSQIYDLVRRGEDINRAPDQELIINLDEPVDWSRIDPL